MAWKRSRNCLPFARTMSATSMAGRVMDADGGRGADSGRRSTASVLRSGWRPGVGAVVKDADTGPWSPDLHDRAEAGWCAGPYQLPAGAWPNCVEAGADLWAYECRPLSPPWCTPAT